ncbi:MAG: EamA family transporter [Bacteroidetes bacterium B1(2017)]|nr:MAG: EamA family transporter [Bacteroidetes bacterium B1(2017)]
MRINLKVHLALFMVSLIYGATFTIAKIAMPEYIKPFGFILLRVSVASVCIFFFHRYYVKGAITDKKDLLPLLVSAIFGVAANMLFFFKGLSITTPINASVLMLNTPIFVVVFATFMLKEKLSWNKILGILTAAFGALMLMGGSRFHFNSNTIWGDIFVTLNAIIYAFYLVYAKRLMVKYHPLTVTLYSFFFGFFLVLPFGLNQVLEKDFLHLPAIIWACIAFITIGSTFLTYVLNAYALRHATSSLVGSYIYLQPVLATIIAIASGKDILTTEKLISMLIVSGGVYLSSYKVKITN